jgi:hypothetical protein
MHRLEDHMKHVLIAILLLGLILSACGPVVTPTATPSPTKNKAVLIATGYVEPTPTIKPTRTATPQLPTKTTLPELESTAAPPPATPVPLAEDDPFRIEMQEKEYSISTLGSLIGPGGYLYSAYVFQRFSLNLYEHLREDWIVAFYVSDGTKNQLINTFYANSYSKDVDIYPQGEYHLMYWDDPPDGRYFPDFLYFIDTSSFDRQTLRLNGFFSDINQNGLPEFSLLGYYCPFSHCEIKYDFYEIRSTHSIVDLAANLPDHLSPYLRQADPPTFTVMKDYNYTSYNRITTRRYYRWDGTDFTDVTLEYASVILGYAEEIRKAIEGKYGSSFDGDAFTINDIDIWRMLLLYENAGEQSKGLEAFLDVTDIAHWPGTFPDTTCWLQLSRATAQKDYAHQRPFSILTQITYGSTPLEEILSRFAGLPYDLSACEGIE